MEPGQLQIKDSKPALLSACREQQGGKEKRQEWGLLAPIAPSWGPYRIHTSQLRLHSMDDI